MPPDGDVAHHTLTPEKPRQSRATDAHKPNGPGLIINAALTIKTMVDRENYVDGKRETRSFTVVDDAEESRLYDARMALTEQLIRATPKSSTEALIIVMHAADRLNFGSAINEGSEIIDACERAIRRACTVLVRELKVDLMPFGSENFLPDYLSHDPLLADEDDREICLRLHKLWWKARQKRLASAERVVASAGRA